MDISIVHSKKIRDNPLFNRIKDGIVSDGIFTNKIIYKNKCIKIANHVNINSLLYNIVLWKKMAVSLNTNNHQISCYRFIHFQDELKEGMIINNPIPFSCSFSYNMVKKWSDNRCCIFKINVPKGTNYTILDKRGNKDS